MALKKKPEKLDDSYTVIAALFKCTNSYVRQVIADAKHEKHKGKRCLAIRQAYLEYKNSKQAIIASLQHYKQISPIKKTA